MAVKGKYKVNPQKGDKFNTSLLNYKIEITD